MKPLKIALIFHGITPDITAGGETAISLIALYLSQEGHQVNVIVTQRKQGLPYKENRQGFCLWRIKKVDIPKLRLFSQLLGIGKILYKIQPDVIFGLGISPGGIASALFGKLLGIPCITMVQGRDLFHGSQALSRFALKWSDKVLVLTTDAKSKLCRIIRRQDAMIVPYGIELKEINLINTPTKKELNILDSERVILYVGRLSREKGISYLISAMPEIIKQLDNVKLVICGEEEGIAPNKNSLVSLVKELKLGSQITFTGKLPYQTVLKYMRLAEVLVLPSLEEDFGLVNLEAMASGLPIIASNVGGIPDVVKDGVNGFLVNPRDVQGIADKVITLLSDDKLRSRISQNNLVRARDYDWANLIKQYEKVCFDALNI
ncbi:MAG: glycosyltransferase family 4 protein [Planctomycetota bacterium]